MRYRSVMTESPPTHRSTTFTLYTIWDEYTAEWCAAIHRARDGHHMTNVRGTTLRECLAEAAAMIEYLAPQDVAPDDEPDTSCPNCSYDGAGVCDRCERFGAHGGVCTHVEHEQPPRAPFDTAETIRLAMRLDDDSLREQAQRSDHRAEHATDPAWKAAHRAVSDACRAEIDRRDDELLRTAADALIRTRGERRARER